MDIDVAAELFVKSGEKMDRAERSFRASAEAKPVHFPIGNSVNATAAPALITIDSRPAVGRVWNILRVALFGSDGHTTVASAVADVYAASAGLEVPDFSAQLVSGSGVPFITTFSRKVEWMKSNERLLAWVYGFTPPQQLVLVARVAEYRVEDVEAMTL